MTINFGEVKKLIDLVIKSGVAEIEVSEGDKTIRVNNFKTPTGFAPLSPVMVDAAQAASVGQAQDVSVGGAVGADAKAKSKEPDNRHTVKSPMVGTVYLASAPGAKHFVEVGQHVKAGDTLCLVEAMKMFNRIEADKAGIVTEVLIDNAQPVEYGQALFIIE